MNIAFRRFLHNHGNIATEGSPKPGLCPTLISKDFKGSLKVKRPRLNLLPDSVTTTTDLIRGHYSSEISVHSNIGSTVHSMALNSLYHCICTTAMTNIRSDRDSNLVPPGYKPQAIRMSHLGRPLAGQGPGSAIADMAGTWV